MNAHSPSTRTTARAMVPAMSSVDPAMPPRPRSAVSTGVGFAGLAGMAIWFVIARHYNMSGPYAALINLVACGIPMVLWSLLVDKVHRNRTTGIDWDRPLPPLRDTLELSITKLAGYWFTWAVIGAIYAIMRFYGRGQYPFAMEVFVASTVPLFILSVPYVVWLDRRLKNPRDGAWALGSWLMGDRLANRAAIADHARAWAVKGFFLAFMVSVVPPGWADVVGRPWAQISSSPVAMADYLITFMFVIDVALATVGYVLTMKVLDAHIRSATPYVDGWVSALICYPPFALMFADGVLDYHPGTQSWDVWMAGHPLLLGVWGAALVVLTAIYAWATVAFGLRFSNLTHRGILTHGPYAFTKHPAYWSKNTFWWLSTLPFLVTTNWVDAVRNTVIMAMVSGVYFWRAKTEEKHLSNDADYRAYRVWMKARWARWLGRKA